MGWRWTPRLRMLLWSMEQRARDVVVERQERGTAPPKYLQLTLESCELSCACMWTSHPCAIAQCTRSTYGGTLIY